jgi:dTDP-4-amino-4,6-dideoxygalactose transaminase
MDKIIKDTEDFLTLSGYFGRRRDILTGRDTTALMLLIEALTGPSGRVILPAMCCMTRLACVLECGRTPVIVDVDENMSMDPDRLSEVARIGDLVVAVHLFGIPCDMMRIYTICKKVGCALVEDVSQAIGAKIEGRPAGAYGDAGILSFADRKILPTNGGGAIVVNDGALYENLEAAVEKLPRRPVDYQEKKRAMIAELEEPFERARSGEPHAAAEWTHIYKKYSDVYKFAIEKEEAELILNSISNFEDTIETRRDMVYMLRKKMSGSNVRFLDYPNNSAPWRFTIILSDNMSGADVVKAVKELRAKGLDASSLYLPLNWLAPSKSWTNGCPVAEHVGVRVINFRVDETTTWSDANLAGQLVKELTW